MPSTSRPRQTDGNDASRCSFQTSSIVIPVRLTTHSLDRFSFLPSQPIATTLCNTVVQVLGRRILACSSHRRRTTLACRRSRATYPSGSLVLRPYQVLCPVSSRTMNPEDGPRTKHQGPGTRENVEGQAYKKKAGPKGPALPKAESPEPKARGRSERTGPTY